MEVNTNEVTADESVTSDVESVETEVVENNDVDVEQLIRERDAAIAEATKQRSIKQRVTKERDDLKQSSKSNDDTTNDDKYKLLWQETNKELETIRKSSRDTQINAALTEQLSKSGIMSDAMEAGRRLVDREMIEFDESGKLDDMSVLGAIQALKAQSSFLFERKIAPTDVKNPTSKNLASTEMTRADFDKLSPEEKSKKMLSGTTLV